MSKLNRALWCKIGNQPLHRRQSLLPFRRLATGICTKHLAPDDIDNFPVQHRSGGIDKNQDPLAIELQTGEILAAALTDKGPDLATLPCLERCRLCLSGQFPVLLFKVFQLLLQLSYPLPFILP